MRYSFVHLLNQEYVSDRVGSQVDERCGTVKGEC